MTTEKKMIENAKRDIKAFEPLYKLYHKRILVFCYQRVEDKQTAQDICSSVFLKAMKKIKSYEDRGYSFGAWLYRIAYNEIQTYYKKNKKVIKVSEDFIIDLSEENQEEPTELFDKMKKVLKLLKPQTIQLIQMRFWEERPFKEIAQILDITESNAKIKTYRGLEKLKKLMKISTDGRV